MSAERRDRAQAQGRCPVFLGDGVKRTSERPAFYAGLDSPRRRRGIPDTVPSISLATPYCPPSDLSRIALNSFPSRHSGISAALATR